MSHFYMTVQLILRLILNGAGVGLGPDKGIPRKEDQQYESERKNGRRQREAEEVCSG